MIGTFPNLGFGGIWRLASAAAVSLALTLPAPAEPFPPMLTRAEALEDFDLLVETLRRDHQGMYQYRPREEIDGRLAELRASITDETELQAFGKIVYEVVALTDQGHADVLPSDEVEEAYGSRAGFIPLTVIVADDAVVAETFYTLEDGPLGLEDSPIAFDERIVAINGEPIDALIADMMDLTATDGHNETFGEIVIGAQFPVRYFIARGMQDRFDIEVEAFETGARRTVTLDPIAGLEMEEGATVGLNFYTGPSEFQYVSLGCGVGYMAIPTFMSGDEFAYDEWYEEVFTQVRDDGVEALVIDLTENGGGLLGRDVQLARYLIPQPFEILDRVTVTKEVFERNADEDERKSWTPDGPLMLASDEILGSEYIANGFDYEQPDPDLFFDGFVAVVTNGGTFSLGTMFSAILHMHDRAEFVGEETGGTYEGTVAGWNTDVELPHSGLQVPVPVMYLHMAVEPDVRGRGVMPDHPVPMTWADYVDERNAPLEVALELAKERAGAPDTCTVAMPEGD